LGVKVKVVKLVAVSNNSNCGGFVPGRNFSVPWSSNCITSTPSRNPFLSNSPCQRSFCNDQNGSGNFSLTVSPNVGLVLQGFNLSTIYNTLVSDSEQSVTIGQLGPRAASVWKTKTVVQVLDDILFPELYPTYTIPSVSFSSSSSGIAEIGTSVSQTLSLTGFKNDAGAFTFLSIRKDGSAINNISSPSGVTITNLPDQYGYPDSNSPNYSYVINYTDSITVTEGVTSWDGTGSFAAGLAKKTSKGTNDTRSSASLSTNAPQSAGSLTSSSVSINGIYPYFWGKSPVAPTGSSIASNIAAGTATKVLASASGSIEATFNAVAEYVWFAHPASDTEKTRWYNTPLNQGSLGPGNFILYPEIQAVDSPGGYWTGVDYYIYISGYATNTSGSIQLLNS